MIKACNKCSKVCDMDFANDFFYKNSYSKDGFKSICKNCDKENRDKYFNAHKDYYNEKHREYNKKPHYKSLNILNAKKRRETHPWEQSFYCAKTRCLNERHKSFKRYGGRGIKFKLSLEEIKFLWVRDEACKLKQPSIDRINPEGNYEINNCRFIELSENSKRIRVSELTRQKASKRMTEYNNKKKENKKWTAQSMNYK